MSLTLAILREEVCSTLALALRFLSVLLAQGSLCIVGWICVFDVVASERENQWSSPAHCFSGKQDFQGVTCTDCTRVYWFFLTMLVLLKEAEK